MHSFYGHRSSHLTSPVLLIYGVFLTLSFILSGCSSAPVKKDADPSQIFEMACSPGKDVQKVSGTVWLRAKSEEASGRFPALVSAQASRLDLEVTNLIGGTEARIKIRDHRYQIEVPGKKSQNRNGVGSWGGIPLQWASDLFLGKIPCPNGIQDAQLKINDAGQLEVDVPSNLKKPAQRFVYSFEKYNGNPWVSALNWESLGVRPVTVSFEFSRPEEKTRSPLSWVAKSEKGEVTAKWRRRELK